MNYRILQYDKLDSTNDQAIAFAKDGAADGTVVVADFQTKGRGQFERTWISPRGKGLLFSILLRPKLNANEAPILTQVAAEAVAEMLKDKFNLPATIKKPNDVLVQRKKIAGILTESSTVGNQLEYVVIGIGLNVTSNAKELLETATSIAIETKSKPKKEEILLDLLGVFNQKYRKLYTTKKAQIHA